MAEILDFTGGRLCEVCEQQIPPKRLAAVPGTTRCVGCEGRAERELGFQAETIDRSVRRNG